jgi:hypothetical protein
VLSEDRSDPAPTRNDLPIHNFLPRSAGADEDAQPGLPRVLQLARELRGRSMIMPMSDRGITAIMFDVHLVEQNFPAAN